MCKFLLKLFGKKEEPTTNVEEQITENMVSNEEPVSQENAEPVAEVIEEPVMGSTASSDEVEFVVLLDNGHASTTPGKRSPMLDDGRRFYEWEFNRDVVRRIAEKLDYYGIKYHIIVPEEDEDIALKTRVARANEYCKEYGKKNCLYISVHSNAYGDGKKWEDPGKWSVWTSVGVTKSDEYGKIFYKVAEEKLARYGFGCRDGKVQGNGNAGPDYESNFTVLSKTLCPAILTENLFFTNKKECEWLMTNTGRQVIADIHVEAIRQIIDSL